GYPITLGRMVSVGHKAMLHGCSIGDGSLIGINSIVMNGARIGKGSLIGAIKAMLHGCSIGDGSLIGINSIVMNGARIGKGSLIGANTLITEGKEIPDGVLVLGSPGKIVRSLTHEDKDYLLDIARGYVERSKFFKQNLREQ